MMCLLRLVAFASFFTASAVLAQSQLPILAKLDSSTPSLKTNQLSFFTGSIPQTWFEKRVGGNDTSLKIIVVTPSSDTVFHVNPLVTPIGFGFSILESDTLQCPLILAIPQNIHLDDAFLQALQTLDSQFQWIENLPCHRDSLKMNALNLSDYIRPLPCGDENLYVEYICDTLIRVFWDDQIFNCGSMAQVNPICVKFLSHLHQFHQLNCKPELSLYFDSENINVVSISEFMGDLSELGFVIHTTFNNFVQEE